MSRPQKYQIGVGSRFGKLVVIAFHTVVEYPSGARHKKWLCMCDCGEQTIALANNLSRGHTESCGCGIGRLTHGMSRDEAHRPTYSAWSGMLSRCRSGHPNYGGRGIAVCERWNSFENFLADMGVRPEGMTIERKDVNGDYCPENCKWATRTEQNNNKRDTRYVEYQGQRLPLAVVHRNATTPITLAAFWIRIRNGWTVERALSQPIEFRRPRRRAVC